MLKDELYTGAVVRNTQVPESFSRRVVTMVDRIDSKFVYVRYMFDYSRKDQFRKVPMCYFLQHWDLEWRVNEQTSN